MKTIANIRLIVFSVFLLQSCKVDCNQNCFTPPEPFVFELVDSISKENLFTNQTYHANDITVVNLATTKVVSHSFISENNKNLIQINTIGWKTEQVTLVIKIADETIFSFFVDAERLDGDCCSFTKYNQITIREVSYSFSTNTGIYRIFI